MLMARIGTMLYMEVKFHRDQKFKSSPDQNLKNSLEMAARRLVERASYYKDLFKSFASIIQLWSFVGLLVRWTLHIHFFYFPKKKYIPSSNFVSINKIKTHSFGFIKIGSTDFDQNFLKQIVRIQRTRFGHNLPLKYRFRKKLKSSIV